MIFKNLQFNKKEVIFKFNIFLTSLIIFELVALGAIFFSTDKNLMNSIAVATTAKQETFTELYFENHLNLPTKIKPNHPYKFNFTVHNLENSDMTYTYEVYLQAGNQKFPIQQEDAVIIPNGQFKTFQVNFQVDAPITRSLIVVNLINKNQQIDFWVEGAK